MAGSSSAWSCFCCSGLARSGAIPSEGSPAIPAIDAPLRAMPVSATHGAAAAAAVLAIAAAWPLYAAYMDRQSSGGTTLVLATPAPAGGWSLTDEPLTDWRPHYDGAAASVFRIYRKGDRAVAVYLGFYRDQRKGAELADHDQRHDRAEASGMVEGRRIAAQGRPRQRIGGRSADVAPIARPAPADLGLVPRLAGQDVVNPYVAKMLLARDRLLGRGDDAAAIILATPYDGAARVRGGNVAAVRARDAAVDQTPRWHGSTPKPGGESGELESEWPRSPR